VTRKIDERDLKQGARPKRYRTGRLRAGEGRSAERIALARRIDDMLAAVRIADIASALNRSPAAVYAWMSGESEPDREMLLELARLCGVRIDWLLTGAPPRLVGEAPPSGQRLILKLFEDDSSPEIWLPREWTEGRIGAGGIALRCMTMTTGAMDPSILPGDILIVDPRGDSREQPPPGIYVFEDRSVRRILLSRPGEVVIGLDNRAFGEKLALPPAEMPEILGRVVARLTISI
jgi:transcriptional regulator with XRE-family HTH domain